MQWGLPRIKADRAWDLTRGDASVVIAVVDTGVMTTHPDLADNLVAGFNTITQTSNVADDHGHGTHVAGIAAAVTDNGLGLAGVAGNSKIMPLKAMGANGSGLTSDIAEAIVWAADNGADVINLSLGSPYFSQVLQDAINYAYNLGAVVVVAAGNENTNALRYPAACNNVITVAATDANNLKASFSNYGSHIDVAAPGVGILSTTRDGGYGYMQGTSMATPFVSGAVALIKAYRPQLTPAQIETLLGITAIDLGAAGKDIYFGYGLIDVERALTEAVDTSPAGLVLWGDSPDPFRPTGTNTAQIKYSVNAQAQIYLEIYDGSNNLIRTLINGETKSAGLYTALWNGKNNAGQLVATGQYTYKVRANSAGGPSQELSGTITVERTNPVISNVAVTGSPFNPFSESANISFNLSEPAKITANIYYGTQLIKKLASGQAFSAGSISLSWNGRNGYNSIVGDGTYTVKITATDYVGLTSTLVSASVVVEGQIPLITINSLSPSLLKVTGTSISTLKYTVSEPVSMNIKIYDQRNNLIRTLVNNETKTGTNTIGWNGKNDAGMLVNDGIYTIKLNASDLSGKTAQEKTMQITTDKTVPTISVLQTGSNQFDPLSGQLMNVSFTISEPGYVLVQILNAANSPVATLRSNQWTSAGSVSLQWNGRNASGQLLADGDYKVKVTVKDGVGFIATATSANFVLESRNPQLTNYSAGPAIFKITGTSLATIKYTLSEPANVTVQVLDSGNNPVRTLLNNQLRTGAMSVTWNGKDDNGNLVADGVYSIKLTATDRAGKTAVPVNLNITTDKTAPLITAAASPSPFSSSQGQMTSISWNCSEDAYISVLIYNSSSRLVKSLVSNQLFLAGTNSRVWNGADVYNRPLSAGTYTIRITARDRAGFTTVTTTTVQIQ